MSSLANTNASLCEVTFVQVFQPERKFSLWLDIDSVRLLLFCKIHPVPLLPLTMTSYEISPAKTHTANEVLLWVK